MVASPDVLDEAGIPMPEESDEDDEEATEGADLGEVEKFREFLEGISPEDFGTPDPGAGPPPVREHLLTLNLHLRVAKTPPVVETSVRRVATACIDRGRAAT